MNATSDPNTVRYASPARVSTYAYVNPVVAVLLGWALAGEMLTSRIAIAAAAIVGAVVLITTAGSRKQTATAPEPSPSGRALPPDARPSEA